MSGTLSLLRIPDIRTLLTARFISMFGSAATVLALYGDARRALFAVVGIMAVGLELSQAGANLLGNVTPPYRVDVHDVLTRAIGATLVYAAMKVFGAIWRGRIPVRLGVHGMLGFIDSLARRT